MNRCWPISSRKSASRRPKTPNKIVFYRDPENIYRVTEFDAFPWLVHGFGTRLADIPARFAQLATLQQIHSGSCVSAEGRAGLLGEGDALIESQPGSVVAVKTADRSEEHTSELQSLR